MNDFADLINDHGALLQGRDRSKNYLTSSRPLQMQGGGVISNTTGCSGSRSINESYGKRNVHPQAHKNDTTVPTSAQGRLFSADEYLGITNIVSDTTMQAQDEQRSKGKDLFLCDDWPQLDSFVDFDADLIRDFDSTFEIGSSYFEDPLWSSICSPDAQLVPSGLFDNPINLSAAASESRTSSLLKSSVSVPDTASVEPVFLDQELLNSSHPDQFSPQIFFEGLMRPVKRISSRGLASRHRSLSSSICDIHPDQFEKKNIGSLYHHVNSSVHLLQINLANPINIQQAPIIGARETYTEEIEHFPVDPDADLLCPFDEMLVPTSSSMMRTDEIASSSTCSGPELVTGAYAPNSAKKSHDPSHATPDMILDGMAANPLDMYFPPLTAYEQPERLMNNDSSAQIHHEFHGDFAGDDVLKNSTAAGLQFSSKGRNSSEVSENPRSPLILEAVPVKHLGFQRLQEGMNQLDVGTKTCIRDALYRLANDVEQRHCVTQITGGGSSGANSGFRTSVWTETPASSMDRSVAQLLLQKPPHRKAAAGCQANHVA